MTSYPSGYVREAGPKERRDGHDVAEVKEPGTETNHEMIRKMSNYMSIGVQGFVGSGFEAHRAGNRLMNMLIYAHESSKWVFWRRFPDLTRFIKNFSQNGKYVLNWPTPEEKQDKNRSKSDLPEISKDPIDLVIQNIPHIWYVAFFYKGYNLVLIIIPIYSIGVEKLICGVKLSLVSNQ
jgi:hypothetical protein